MDFDFAARRVGYEVYSRAGDEVVHADDILARPGPHYGIAHFADRFDGMAEQALVAAREIEDDPLADASADPSDVLVTFIVSMGASAKGERLLRGAAAVAAQARRLEELGYGACVLGYTTKHWSGGTSAHSWIEDGRPERPGRIADLRHVVLKGAREPVSDRRMKILLSDALRKENVDGEALAWAATTAMGYGTRLHAIVHVTDKCLSVDEATIAANEKGFLDRHAKAVVREIAEDGRIGLAIVGVGVYDGDTRRFLDDASSVYPAVEVVDDQAGVEQVVKALGRGVAAAVRLASPESLLAPSRV